MVRCNFCGKEIPQGTGKLFIRTDGRSLSFCSNKCQKNLLELKRKPRNTRWTEEFRKVKENTKESDKK